MKLVFSVVVALCIVTFLFPAPLFADIPPSPTSFEACRGLEQELWCAGDSCSTYSNNRNYRLSTMTREEYFGGTNRHYCYQPYWQRLLLAIVITVGIELGVYYFFIAYSLKRVFSVVLVNCISLPLMYYLQNTLPPIYKFDVRGLLSRTLMLEILVLIVEIIIIKLFVPKMTWRRTIGVCVIANIISAIFGTFIYSLFFVHTP